MKIVPLKELEVGKKIDFFIYHQSGQVLHRPGDELTLANIAILEECGIGKVALLQLDEDGDSFSRAAVRKSVSLEDLIPGEASPVTLYDENEAVIVEEGAVISAETIQRCTDQKLDKLYFEKDRQEMQNFQYSKYCSLCESELFESIASVRILEHPKEREKKAQEEEQRKLQTRRKKEIFDGDNLVLPDDVLVKNKTVDISTQSLKNSMKSVENLKVPPKGPELMQLTQWVTTPRPAADKEEYAKRYDEWGEKLQKIFTSLKANQEIETEQLYEIARPIITLFINDAYYCLNLVNLRCRKSTVERVVESHCVNVAILICGMGVILGYNAQQLLEMVCGALMHDVGHISTYRQLLVKEKLDSSEQKRYDEHSILGLAVLKNISKVPLSMPYIIYQHHERMNGSGRILHCLGDKLHDFARCLAVADEFDTLCRTKSPFAAMSAVIALTKAAQHDPAYTKTLLVMLSLFPIGCIVQTNNNIIGKVVGTNPDNFKLPLVRSLFMVAGKQLQEIKNKELIDLKTDKKIQIVKDIIHPVLGEKIALGF